MSNIFEFYVTNLTRAASCIKIIRATFSTKAVAAPLSANFQVSTNFTDRRDQSGLSRRSNGQTTERA